MFVGVVFFLFKQKTAYEMRISDWSSDVCSSDLVDVEVEPGAREAGGGHHDERQAGDDAQVEAGRVLAHQRRQQHRQHADRRGRQARPDRGVAEVSLQRSEEHTSELQSLMRISYAVFCLKKKTTNTNTALLNTY